MAKNKTNSTQSETAENSQVLSEALYRLTSQWPLDSSKTAGKRESLHSFLREVGRTRFETAILRVIAEHVSEYMPPTSVIRQYAPEAQTSALFDEAEWARLSADRRLHPENYFGVPDVVCAMRAQAARLAAKQPLYNSDELFKIIALAREKYGPKFETAFNVKDF